LGLCLNRHTAVAEQTGFDIVKKLDVYSRQHFVVLTRERQDLMRAAFQLLFLLFYCSSNYATTQHRISYFVHELQHSNSRIDDSTIEESCQERIRYTRFREAKQASLDYFFLPDLSPKFFPLVSTRQFIRRTVSLLSHFEIETSHSRAPPM